VDVGSLSNNSIRNSRSRGKPSTMHRSTTHAFVGVGHMQVGSVSADVVPVEE
jgi:hypothetical protein